jgi:hypothetical protein
MGEEGTKQLGWLADVGKLGTAERVSAGKRQVRPHECRAILTSEKVGVHDRK